jgi:hypothetical protein
MPEFFADEVFGQHSHTGEDAPSCYNPLPRNHWQGDAKMVWYSVGVVIDFLVDIFTVRWKTADKDLEILILRQQLRVFSSIKNKTYADVIFILSNVFRMIDEQ